MTDNNKNLNPVEIKIIGLTDRYLRVEPETESNENHLDEDTLTAFVEGTLANRESKPVVSHLVECSFCRHITAELVKLEIVFAEETVSKVRYKTEPTKVSEVLDGILSRLFGTSDGAAFAHEEKPEDENDGVADDDNNKQ